MIRSAFLASGLADRPLRALLAALERSHALACAALVVLSLALFLPGFVSLQPMDRDEPRFAQATKQMLETHDFVSIRFQGEARNKKPAGIYWLQALSVATGEALGIPDARHRIWLYRLPSLLGATAAVLLTYWTALALLPRRFAILAAAALAATVLLGVEARLAKTDAVLTATVVLAMGALARLWMAPGSRTAVRAEPFLFWIAIAVGILIKGPITPMVAGLAALVLCVVARSGRWLRPLGSWKAIALGCLLVAPWFVAIAIETQGAFFREAVGTDMLGKVAGGRESHGAPPGTYLAASLVTLWPLAPFALIAAVSVWRARRDRCVAFALAWLIPSWLVFEAVPTKLPHYVLPLYPAIAILLAWAAQSGALSLPRRWTPILAAILFPLPLLALAIAIPILTWLYGGHVQIVGAAIVAVGACLAAAAVWRWVRGGEAAAAMLAGLAAVLLLAIGAYDFAVPGLTELKLSPRLVDALGAARCRPDALATAGYDEPSLVFLTRTDLVMTDGAGAAAFLSGPGCRAAFVDIRQEPAFAQAFAGRAREPRLLGRVAGVNLNGGRKLDIGVYASEP